RYHCRTWALEHDGVLPDKVEIVKQWYVVPGPEKMRKIGPYEPEEFLAKHGKQKLVYTAHCAREPDAQPTNEQRLRHGLPPVDEGQIRRAIRPQYEQWQRRDELAAERKAAADKRARGK
ncbi:MAG: hypothetical protein KC431_03475, partial [Myxococcales bacterium]|nr:hypothetical protein [Myxococcales bacterium]